MLTTSQTTTEFRPDIEGLRAIAVLLVMLYHFNAPFISGGYIGVDIFFVISGFLICRIVSSSVDGRHFSFFSFYQKRIKRLMPVLTLVSIVTVAVFSFFLLPQDYIFLLRSLRDLFGLTLNLFFAKEMQDYFAPDAASAPFLHGWTLSVEWQFYLLLPVLLVVLRRLVTANKLVWVLAAMTALAIAYSMQTVSANDNVYYYFGPRLFEFLIGALLAFISMGMSDRGSAWLQSIAISGMVLVSLYYTRATPFPGAAALIVCLFAAMFILARNTRTWVCTGPMRTVGRLSYSAYLWHWPVVALAYHQDIPLTGAAWLPLTLLVFVLSWLSYTLVEKPCRASQLSFSLSLVAFMLLPLVFTMAGVDHVRKHKGYPQRLGRAAQNAVRKIAQCHSENQKQCHDFKGDDLETCKISSSAGHTAALLTGDSHAGHYWQFVGLLAEDAGVNAYGMTASRCQALASASNTGRWVEDHCAAYNERIKALISDNNFAYVVIAQRWGSYLHLPNADNGDEAIVQRLMDRLQYAVNLITENGALPIFLLPVAEDGSDKNRCVYQKLSRRRPVKECDMPDARHTSKGLKLLSKGFAAIQTANPEVIIVDPRLAQCREGICASSYEKVPLYSDRHHLNPYGSHVLAETYLLSNPNPLNGLK